jgi:regulator of extracellular matrix RemA (YlzA/DUF370 family)
LNKFVTSPNLPQENVTAVIVDFRAKKLIEALNMLGISTITTDFNDNLPIPISSHPDIICHHLGNNNIIVPKIGNNNFKNKLKNLNMNIIEAEFEFENKYPCDCLLDCARIGNLFICNKSITDKKIIKYAEENNIKVINTTQGYSKCSICIVDENSIITSDIELSKQAQNARLDVLLINTGYINLTGYKYGFIGGTCGKLSKNSLAFAGDINTHIDANKIIDFAKSKNVEVISLCKGISEDIGGIIPILEKASLVGKITKIIM